MPSSLIALGAAASFLCVNPTHHDGDNLRCANVPGSMRLQGIDAPEMPGACRPGRRCVPGDPYRARDHLRALTAGKVLQCTVEDVDRYGRNIVNCTAGGVNISCAMIASGLAVQRYAGIECDGRETVPLGNDEVAALPAADAPRETGRQPGRDPDVERIIVPANTPEVSLIPVPAPLHLRFDGWLVLPALLLINAVTWLLFFIDKRRAQDPRGRGRIPERTLLTWAAIGGTPAAWHALARLRHKSAKASFQQRLLLISGLQIGGLVGGLYWWLAG